MLSNKGIQLYQWSKLPPQGLPGCPGVKNSPSNAGGMGSIPSGVGTHMQPSPSTATTEAGSGARVPQQAKPAHLSQREATASHS